MLLDSLPEKLNFSIVFYFDFPFFCSVIKKILQFLTSFLRFLKIQMVLQQRNAFNSKRKRPIKILLK